MTINSLELAQILARASPDLKLHSKGLGDAGAIAVAQRIVDPGPRGAPLRALRLFSNGIGDAGAAAIGAALIGNTSLRALYLHSNEIGALGAAAMARGLSGGNNSALHTLFLKSNRIGDEGAAQLGAALGGGEGGDAAASGSCWACPLETLYVQENGIGLRGARALGAALRCNQILTTLGLQCNPLGDAGVVAIADGVARNSALTSLDLFHTECGVAGCDAVGRALGAAGRAEATRSGSSSSSSSALRELSLGYNKAIGARGAALLLRLLTHGGNTALTTLALHNIDLAGGPPPGAVQASKAEVAADVAVPSEGGGVGSSNSSTVSGGGDAAVAVGGVGVGAAPLHALAALLADGCGAVESLSLNCNALGDPGAIALAQGLASCPALRRLELKMCGVGEAGAAALRSAASAPLRGSGAARGEAPLVIAL
tara:strand:- start:170 stop:1456 length:1287 start_codon:yes stop_codon:yes gene_type:complete